MKAGKSITSGVEDNHSFVQAVEILVGQDVRQITSTISAWNQSTNWSTGSDQFFSNIKLPLLAEPQQSQPDHFNGFGFWVCGVDTNQSIDQSPLTKSSSDQVYIDKI